MPSHVHRPDFLIIGAQKAGTTSAHHALCTHPSIWMPSIKELHAFDSGATHLSPQELERYFSIFSEAPAGSTRGEATPSYLYAPHAAASIHAALGSQVKLIVLLRNPAKRAYSHYLMNLRKGYEKKSFADALEAEERRLEQGTQSMLRYSYISRGYYHEQISRYLEYFDHSMMRIYVFEQDIIPAWENVWTGLCSFLDLPHDATPPLQQSNSARQIRSPLVSWAMRQPVLKRMKNKVISRNANLKLRHALSQRAPAADPEMIAALNDRYFKNDIKKLETLLNRPLNAWR
ncbi:sulfotransferase domain-containing protein [Oceanococcus atlanticus]|nr:sulfotransferase domain-containing protein [Oceanococcus atlanticus]